MHGRQCKALHVLAWPSIDHPKARWRTSPRGVIFGAAGLHKPPGQRRSPAGPAQVTHTLAPLPSGRPRPTRSRTRTWWWIGYDSPTPSARNHQYLGPIAPSSWFLPRPEPPRASELDNKRRPDSPGAVRFPQLFHPGSQFSAPYASCPRTGKVAAGRQGACRCTEITS